MLKKLFNSNNIIIKTIQKKKNKGINWGDEKLSEFIVYNEKSIIITIS